MKNRMPLFTYGTLLVLFQQGDTTVEARKELRIEQRKQLILRMEDMKKTLDRLDDKITRYEQAVVGAEKTLSRKRV